MHLWFISTNGFKKKNENHKNVNMKSGLKRQMITGMTALKILVILISHGKQTNVSQLNHFVIYYLQEFSTSILLQKHWKLSHKCILILSVHFYVFHKSSLTFCKFSRIFLCPNYRLTLLNHVVSLVKKLYIEVRHLMVDSQNNIFIHLIVL